MLIALITPDRAYHPFVTMIVEGLRERGDEFFASDPGNGLLAEEVLEMDAGWLLAAERADAILVFFGKAGSLAAGEPRTRAPKAHLLEELEDGEVSPRARATAYLDYSEMTATGHPMPGQVEAMRLDPKQRVGKPWFNEWALEHCEYYFKRESMPDDVGRAGVYPLPFGMLAEYAVPLPRHGKDWDLFCCFGHTETGLRKEIIAECQRLKAERRDKKIVIRERMPLREYREACARSKVVVDAWGHGDNCYRLWEGVGAKACVLYQRYQVETGPEWFEEGEEIVGYSSVKEFRQKAESLLALPLVTMGIGRMGHARAQKHHTGLARVNYILKTMRLL